MSVLNGIYITCLAIGVIYSLVTVFINGIFDGLDLDLDLDLDAGIEFLLPVKPFTVMIFVTVFGGAGLILYRFISPLWTVPLSVVIAYLVSMGMYRCIYIPLFKSQTEVGGIDDVLGLEATVVEKIQPGGFGKISFTLDGNITSAPAKESVAGEGFTKGERVYINLVAENVYHVSKDRYFVQLRL